MEKNKKILITGADGMVGSYVDFGYRTDKNSLDISDAEAVTKAFREYKPEIVLHLAAETDVDRCEREPEHAYKINTIGTYNIAKACKEFNAKMIYISSTSVFDGKKNKLYSEEDSPNPQNVYGRTKYLGEIIVKDIVNNHLIIRAGWMFGGGPKKDKKFVSKVIKQIPAGEIKAVNDIMGSPIYAKDLINKIIELVDKNEIGTFHVVNKNICSRYDMAGQIINLLKAPIKIIPVSSDYFGQDAKRGDETLSSKITDMRSWQDALKEYLETEW